jgi:DNA-binding LytR/AlgR family response regulator
MQNGKKIKCLIVDDEPPAQEILKKHIARVESLELAGNCSNAVDALSFLQNNPVDLIFLDIQMPHILGTSFVRTLKSPPKVIFTTAYRKFAVEGFELNAVDYLLKPIGFERFLQSINKVFQTNIPAPDTNKYSEGYGLEKSHPFLYFRVDRKMVKVMLNDILIIEGLKDYIKIITNTKTIVTKHLLSSLEEMLPADSFLRIHRSYIISINKIDSYKADSIEIGKKELPIGRLYKHDVEKFLNTSSASLQSPNHGSNNHKNDDS